MLFFGSLTPTLAKPFSFKNEIDGKISANEGHHVLSWEGGQAPYTLYKLDINGPGKKKQFYQGKDHAFFITGLSEGIHTFQIIDANQSLIQTKVSVSYPSKWMVLFSLISGAILFIILCIVIIWGNKKYALSST